MCTGAIWRPLKDENDPQAAGHQVGEGGRIATVLSPSDLQNQQYGQTDPESPLGLKIFDAAGFGLVYTDHIERRKCEAFREPNTYLDE